MSEDGNHEKKKRDDEEIDPDQAPEPQPFQAPKGLMKMGDDQGPVEVQSGSATGSPPPLTPPPGAEVRTDKPEDRPKPPLDLPHQGPINIRFPVPTGRPKPPVPKPEDFGPVDVRTQKGAAKLPRIEAPGEFDVVRQTASPSPRPRQEAAELLEGDVEVVDYRKTGPVDVEAADPFATYKRIGVVDTTFARVNMGAAAEDELKALGGEQRVMRRTVPGIKDLAVECKRLIEDHGCHVVIACGMVGGAPIDQQCAHEAALGLQWAKLMTNTHILEVFVHQNEAKDEKELAWLMDRRTREHAKNAWNLLFDADAMRRQAGTGQRQGFDDEGPLAPGQ